MMFQFNNPTISWSTRCWLNRLATTNTLLDENCLALLTPAITKVRQVHPGGLVFSLALDLGAEEEIAIIAGSAAELFYAACSLTDDIQDGDVISYMDTVPLNLQINAQVQLICLVSVRLNEMTEKLKLRAEQSLVLDLYKTLAIMLTGQRMEIERDPWNGDVFKKVADLSAGEQFAIYMRFASEAAQKPAKHWTDFGRSLGNALQVIADIESSDERFVTLHEAEQQQIIQQFRSELAKSAKQCQNNFIDVQVDALLDRWDRCLKAN